MKTEIVIGKYGAIAVVGTLLLLFVGFCWYTSGVQAAVYRRQGVEMSTWEVFMGAKPAERTINVK